MLIDIIHFFFYQELGLDYDMLEEDQMMRAIAMSLGQDITNTPAEDQVQQP